VSLVGAVRTPAVDQGPLHARDRALYRQERWAGVAFSRARPG